MARAIRFLKQNQTKFSKLFLGLCHIKSHWEVWADFIAMSALAISNSLDREGSTHDAREQEYLTSVGKYTKAEQQIFPQLFGLMVEALENDSNQDFLGEMFMGFSLSNHWKGQFFTPYNVCRLTAEMQLNDLETRIEKQGWVGISDPCCGAGAMLIAARNVMVQKRLGPTTALYVAQDIDRTAALMCYLQLSLLGCAGFVVVADSFKYPITGPGRTPLLITPTPEQEIWLMPALYNDVWYGRIQWERMRLALEGLDIMTSKSPIQKKTPSQKRPKIKPVPQSLNKEAGGQLTLF